jgi:hypothetical protein
MSRDASGNSVRWLLIILVGAALLFCLLSAILFRFYPLPSSAADFGQAISGLSALFTALAFAGALYAVFLQRKALELQQQQMTKQIGEVREQTNLLADRLQQIAPIYRPYDRLDATVEFTEAMIDGAKKSVDEAIMYFPDNPRKADLKSSLATFLDAAEKYVRAGAEMEELAMAGGKARGGIVKAHLKWVNKREEIARQLGEWANGIREATNSIREATN